MSTDRHGCGCPWPDDEPAIADNEPKWAAPKHHWNVSACLVCWYERRVNDESTGYVYRVGHTANTWHSVAMPCIARIAEPFPGLYTTRQAREILRLTKDAFTHRVQIRHIRPAAVGMRNEYYWREEQFALIVADR